MNRYNLVAESEYSTVLAKYKPKSRKSHEYQSEAELENYCR